MRRFAVTLILIILPTGIFAQESMRETFAMIIGAALVAQKECDLPGETKRAKAYVDSFGSGFDGMRNPDDAKLLIYAGATARAGLRSHGRQSWCEEYMAIKNLIRAY